MTDLTSLPLVIVAIAFVAIAVAMAYGTIVASRRRYSRRGAEALQRAVERNYREQD